MLEWWNTGKRRRDLCVQHLGKLCLAWSLLGALMPGDVLAKPKIDFDGDLEVGLGYVDQGFHSSVHALRIYQEKFYQILRLQLDYDIEVHPRFGGSFDLRGDVDDLGVMVGKAYVEARWLPLVRLRVGSMKKRLTIEENEGRSDLLTVERSLLHRYLDSFHIMGHDFSVEVRVERKRDSDFETSIWGLGGAQGDGRAFGNLKGAVERPWGTLTLEGFYGHHQRNADVGVAGMSYETAKSPGYGSLELYCGSDPNAIDLLKRLGVPATVMFAAGRMFGSYAFRVERGLLQAVEPLGGLTYVVPDMRNASESQLQAVGGANLRLATKVQARWMSNGEVIWERADGADGHVVREYAVYSQVQIAW